MTTATIAPTASITTTPIAAIVRRFAWKEYRLLRGLWLAVLGLGMIEQCVLTLLAPPGTDVSGWLFGSALAAAALYAVGAAATVFSVEHEEETYGFLSGLPTTWWPVFAGKLLFATLSAATLAAVLANTGAALAGWLTNGLRWPAPANAALLTGIFGLAIFEAIAWGTLFSLVVKRPLVAAILAVVVGSTAVHLATYASVRNELASYLPKSYVAAIPLRLATCALVFGLSLLAARRWLAVDTVRTRPAIPVGQSLRDWRIRVSERLGSETAGRGSRGGMLARLLWQTWHDSWRILLLPIGVAAFLFVVTTLLVGLIDGYGFGPGLAGLTLFLTPALYGALVFGADQRRGHYRFLGDHAARPRYVWLARHVVWLGAASFVALTAAIVVATVGSIHIDAYVNDYVAVHGGRLAGNRVVFNATDAYNDLLRASRNTRHFVALAAYGTLAAYAIGQWFSMLLRSEILAAFLSLVLSVVLAAWVATLFAWQLAGWQFLLPLAAGLLAATWLRAPNWIADRNSWRRWLAPALAIAAPLVLIAFLLPVMRLGQIPAPQAKETRDTLVAKIKAFEGGSAAVSETAEMYIKAANALNSGIEGNSPLAPWDKPEYKVDPLGGIERSRIPAEQMEAFKQAVAKQGQMIHDATIGAAVEASRRPSCRFNVDWSDGPRGRLYINDGSWQHDWSDINPTYASLIRLNQSVAMTDWPPDVAMDRFVAALRMCAHLRSGQPSEMFRGLLVLECDILDTIAKWASSESRTTVELHDAIEEFRAYLKSWPDPTQALVADHLLVRNVLLGKTLPLVFAREDIPPSVHLAYLANKLPWERERALRALDVFTLKNIQSTYDLLVSMYGAVGGISNDLSLGYDFHLRQLARSPEDENWTNALRHPQAATSYLALFEYQSRVDLKAFFRQICNWEATRRATLLQLALIAYRREHGKYPDALTDVVPGYLDREPLDPYSVQSFQYAPAGLDLPYLSFVYRTIPSRTPLLFSVGPGDERLVREERRRSDPTNAASDGEPKEVKETVYVLRGGSYYWRWSNESDLVFPLPK